MWIQEGLRNNWHDLHTRQFQEKCQEQNVDLYMTFVDYLKHLTQSVVRDWRIMAKFVCPAKFIAMERKLHDDILIHFLGQMELSKTVY